MRTIGRPREQLTGVVLITSVVKLIFASSQLALSRTVAPAMLFASGEPSEQLLERKVGVEGVRLVAQKKFSNSAGTHARYRDGPTTKIREILPPLYQAGRVAPKIKITADDVRRLGKRHFNRAIDFLWRGA
jgi:hypothetical protein